MVPRIDVWAVRKWRYVTSEARLHMQDPTVVLRPSNKDRACANPTHTCPVAERS